MGINWDSTRSVVVPGPIPLRHVRLEVMETALAVAWGRSWEAELDSSQPMSLSPSLAGPGPADSSTEVPQLGAPSHVPTITLGKQGCKERQGPTLELHIPTPLQGAAGELGAAPHPPALDLWGDFNKGLFSCRGSWCYPRRGSPRRRLFPR